MEKKNNQKHHSED